MDATQSTEGAMVAKDATAQPGNAPNAAARPKITSIQVLRGVAVALVALYHCTLAYHEYFRGSFLGEAFATGQIGVDIFFVLSGFIIYSIHKCDLGRSNRAVPFAKKRLVRIFPIYWIAVLLKYALTKLPGFRGGGVHFTAMDLVYAVLLLPIESSRRVMKVSWSLSFEIFFYAMFLVAILLPRKWFGYILGVWAVAIIVALGLDRTQTSPFVQMVLSPRNFGFLCGIALAWFFARERPSVRVTRPLMVAGGLAFVAGLVWAPPQMNAAAIVPVVVGTALFLYGLLYEEADRGIQYPGWAIYLGDASYSIYLLHTIAISTTYSILSKLFKGGHLPLPVMLVVPVVALGSGCLAYAWVERPLLKKLRPLTS